MMHFKIGKKEYHVRFTHRLMFEGDLLDRVKNLSQAEGVEAISKNVELAAELLLAGLQKKHAEFQYTSDEERQEKIYAILDLFDDYDDQYEAEGKNSFTLFNELYEELIKNGFLSDALGLNQEAVIQTEQTQTEAEE